MRKVTVPLIILGAFFASVLASAPAWAQATRTWVSAVGDDLNPCSRTVPCNTFSAATPSAVLNIEPSMSTNNGTGLVCNTGTTVRLCNTTLSNNTTTVAGSGTCSSYKNNDIDAVLVPALTPINPQ